MQRLRSFARRTAQALLLVALSAGGTFLVLELAVRLLAPQQLIVLRSDIWQPVEGVGWRHRPHADTEINTGDGPARVITDERGHRIGPERQDTAPPPDDPALRVLALGDSFLEAVQVDYEDTFAAHLEQDLTRTLGAPARVVNTGVGGWAPDQYLLEARAELDRRPYDAVLVFVYLPNDRVVMRRDSYPPHQAAERRRLRLPRSLARRELVDSLAYPINDLLERRSHLFTLLKERAKFLLMRAGLSAHYFPSVLETGGSADTVEAWRLTAQILAEIRDLAATHDAPTLVVLLSGVYQVDAAVGERYARAVGLAPDDYDLEQASRLLGQALDAIDVAHLDTLPALRAALAAGEAPLYGRVDTHLSPAGHRVVAGAVLPELVALLRSKSAASPGG